MSRAIQEKIPGLRPVRQVDIVVADGFVLTELAAVADVFRIANRVCVRPLFSWTYRSRRGGRAPSSAGADVDTLPIPDRPNADYVFVIGNSDPDHPELATSRWISSYAYRNAQVFLSRHIANHGAAGGFATTHWENSAFMRERHTDFEAANIIAAENGSIVTCAGMGSTFDVAISVAGRHMSRIEMATLVDIFLLQPVRRFDCIQVEPGTFAAPGSDGGVNRCIELMRANLEEPIRISKISRAANMSVRSMERRFNRYFAKTPNAFYRELRLTHGKSLLLNTSLSICEIGMVCGYTSGFSTAYKKVFNATPAEYRRQGACW